MRAKAAQWGVKNSIGSRRNQSLRAEGYAISARPADTMFHARAREL